MTAAIGRNKAVVDLPFILKAILLGLLGYLYT